MDVYGKTQSMGRNGLESTHEFMMVRPSIRHYSPPIGGQNMLLVYDFKPLNDKAFTPSGLHKTFCYTWHTLRRPGERLAEKRRPG
jgi:hypothetical protein